MSKNNLLVPGAIIVSGLLIVGSIFMTKNEPDITDTNDADKKVAAYQNAKVTAKDHFMGDPNAPIVIVEYSDMECPYCKNFHQTMQQVMDEYIGTGKVAWVYRHFPISQLHSKAPREAAATECAASLGGEEKFWEYLNKIFEITPSNNKLDLEKLPEVAESMGIDREAFLECIDSGTHTKRIQDQMQSAQDNGARGTPYSVGIVKDGDNFVIPGALPYSEVKTYIEEALNEIGA